MGTVFSRAPIPLTPILFLTDTHARLPELPFLEPKAIEVIGVFALPKDYVVYKCNYTHERVC